MPAKDEAGVGGHAKDGKATANLETSTLQGETPRKRKSPPMPDESSQHGEESLKQPAALPRAHAASLRDGERSSAEVPTLPSGRVKVKYVKASFAPEVIARAIGTERHGRAGGTPRHPDDDAPPNETAEERRLRRNRINERRKRARRIQRLDFFTEQYHDLKGVNDELKRDNADLKAQIKAVRARLSNPQALLQPPEALTGLGAVSSVPTEATDQIAPSAVPSSNLLEAITSEGSRGLIRRGEGQGKATQQLKTPSRDLSTQQRIRVALSSQPRHEPADAQAPASTSEPQPDPQGVASNPETVREPNQGSVGAVNTTPNQLLQLLGGQPSTLAGKLRSILSSRSGDATSTTAVQPQQPQANPLFNTILQQLQNSGTNTSPLVQLQQALRQQTPQQPSQEAQLINVLLQQQQQNPGTGGTSNLVHQGLLQLLQQQGQQQQVDSEVQGSFQRIAASLIAQSSRQQQQQEQQQRVANARALLQLLQNSGVDTASVLGQVQQALQRQGLQHLERQEAAQQQQTRESAIRALLQGTASRPLGGPSGSLDLTRIVQHLQQEKRRLDEQETARLQQQVQSGDLQIQHTQRALAEQQGSQAHTDYQTNALQTLSRALSERMHQQLQAPAPVQQQDASPQEQDLVQHLRVLLQQRQQAQAHEAGSEASAQQPSLALQPLVSQPQESSQQQSVAQPGGQGAGSHQPGASNLEQRVQAPDSGRPEDPPQQAANAMLDWLRSQASVASLPRGGEQHEDQKNAQE